MKYNGFGTLSLLVLILVSYIPVIVVGFVANRLLSSGAYNVPCFQKRKYHYYGFPVSDVNTYSTTMQVRNSNIDNEVGVTNDLRNQKNDKTAQMLKIMSLSLFLSLSSSVMPVTAEETKDIVSLNSMEKETPWKQHTVNVIDNTFYSDTKMELVLPKSHGCGIFDISQTIAVDGVIDETTSKQAVAQEGGKWFFIAYVVFSFAAGAVEMTKRFQTWLENRQ